MSYTVTLQQRIQQLKKAQADLPNILYKTAKEATKEAVATAAAATPPEKGEKTGRLAGPNMLTGQLHDSWAEASVVEPRISGGKYQTELNNKMDYASYVDQGHRMDKHFVPGLYIDENGQLARDLERDVGLVVGTKTKYVKGEFMVDKAKEAYEKSVLAQLDKEIARLFK